MKPQRKRVNAKAEKPGGRHPTQGLLSRLRLSRSFTSELKSRTANPPASVRQASGPRPARLALP